MSEFFAISVSDSSALWQPRPGWGSRDAGEAMPQPLRTRGGRLYAPRWFHHVAASIPLSRVETPLAGALHDWWRLGASVAWCELGGEGPRTSLVRVVSSFRPLGRKEPPAAASLAGTLHLAGTGAGGSIRGAPFVLDHARFGTLDTFNALL